MYDAILSSEDPRYYQHGGVDLIGTARALLQQRAAAARPRVGRRSASSTSRTCSSSAASGMPIATEELTEDEVLANCWTEATTASGNDGIQRKLQEMRYAIALEQKYSKNDILLGYLNIANFGGTTYGIDAAARYYFGVAAKDLTLGQAATLAGIVQNPNTYRIDKPTDRSSTGRRRLQQGARRPDRRRDAGSSPRSTRCSPAARSRRSSTSPPRTATPRPRGASSTSSAACSTTARSPRSSTTPRSIEPITPVITPADDRLRGGRRLRVLLPVRARHHRERPRVRRDRRGAREGAQARRAEHLHDDRLPRAGGRRAGDGGNVPVVGRRHEARLRRSSASRRPPAASSRSRRTRSSARMPRPRPIRTTASLVFAGDHKYGSSNGFDAGSTFKLFTLIDWLEKGHSVNESAQRQGPQDHQDQGQLRPRRRTGSTPARRPDQELRRRRRLRRHADAVHRGVAELRLPRAWPRSSTCATSRRSRPRWASRSAQTASPCVMDGAFSVIGSNDVSPIAMAGAYATVANNGIYCQPKAIDRVTDSDGNEIAAAGDDLHPGASTRRSPRPPRTRCRAS